MQDTKSEIPFLPSEFKPQSIARIWGRVHWHLKFIFLKGRETESLHLWIHSPNACNSQGWVGDGPVGASQQTPEQQTQKSYQVSHVHGRDPST